MNLKKIVMALLSFVFLATALPAVGISQETTQESWHFTADAYLWGASIGGDSSSGSDIDIDFDDLLDNLKMAFMGGVQARKGKWSLGADVIYLDVSDDTQVGSGEKLSVELQGWIITPAVGYNLVDSEKARWDVLGGARYFYLKTILGLGSQDVSESGNVWDGIVGIRGHLNLGEKWYLPYYGDIGTGDSEFTWQGFGGIGYRFQRVDVIAGYRYLYYNFDNSPVFDNLNLSGPLVGVKLKF